MEWYQNVVGAPEAEYNVTKKILTDLYDAKGGTLAGWAIGNFYFTDLNKLREKGIAAAEKLEVGEVTVEHIKGESRSLHSRPENEKAMFQVASQFNCLEFPSARCTPEDGVTNYIFDKTQGPACAVACGAATIYRNYLVDMKGSFGQTKAKQLNALEKVFKLVDNKNTKMLVMRNGYLDATSADALSHLSSFHLSEPSKAAKMTDCIKVGAHFDAQVTDIDQSKKFLVGQCFCAATAIGYSRARADARLWSKLSQIILDAQYEASIWYTILYHEKCVAEGTQRAVPKLLLTKVGGGVFGNEHPWIASAMQRAIGIARKHKLSIDIKVVHYGKIDSQYLCVE
eukprot:TRINITY_DN3790_c2_g2_i1.p1 TRINITY_DN3790_c2_g2~~TRINITY_DN3790_c2_g2_i1.p1  ORF type:complete len:341 (+),score=38.24 TRINITY_DN3790_c2_g2_i1:123-1145(+)